MKERIRLFCSRARMAILAGILITAGSSLAFNRITQAQEGSSDRPRVRLAVNTTPIDRENRLTPSFAPAVKKAAPSVVKVFTTTTVKRSARHPGLHDPFFRQFFGPDWNQGELDQGRLPKQHGLGSGVIVTKDGYILTNNHVVDQADRIRVALIPDGREYSARLIGKDAKTDVAVLKIEADDLPHIEMADSDQIEVGDLVLAVGNPYGIGQTVTMGMVSGTGRGSLGLDYEDFIQTDAAINPGNSGGALVDVEGRLIGINTAILSRSGGNQGIGFAIPVNLARHVMESLIEHGRVIRGFMGVNIQDLTPDLASEFDLKDTSGVLVAEVTPDSPADKAGLRSGDVIVQFEGKPVRSSRQLRLQVSQTPPGESVSVAVLRDGKTRSLRLTLRELPGEAEMAKKGSGSDRSEERLRGVAVTDLDREARVQFQLPRNVSGALVARVDADSPAYEAGLREGDVILEMNRRPVANAEEAIKLAESSEDSTILLRVWRDGASRYVVVDEGK